MTNKWWTCSQPETIWATRPARTRWKCPSSTTRLSAALWRAQPSVCGPQTVPHSAPGRKMTAGQKRTTNTIMATVWQRLHFLKNVWIISTFNFPSKAQSSKVITFVCFNCLFVFCDHELFMKNPFRWCIQTRGKKYLNTVQKAAANGNFAQSSKANTYVGLFQFSLCSSMRTIVCFVPQFVPVSPLHRLHWVWPGGWNWLLWFANFE